MNKIYLRFYELNNNTTQLIVLSENTFTGTYFVTSW